jgi:hypothetical protein
LQLDKALESAQSFLIETMPPPNRKLPLVMRPRIPHVTILAVGGWRVNEHLCRMVEVYDTIADKWGSVSVISTLEFYFLIFVQITCFYLQNFKMNCATLSIHNLVQENFA